MLVSLLIGGGSFLVFGLKYFIDDIIMLFDSFGYYPAPLYKLKQAYEVGVAGASSGRDVIFTEAIQLIELGLLYPFGISYYSESTGYTSPHNFFLEVIISSGFLSVFVILAYFVLLPVIIFGKYLNQSDYFEPVVIANFFVMVFTKLMLSSSYLSEGGFYILTIYMLTMLAKFYDSNRVK
ncbi:hypothetical protein [Vibrio agarivorans]|uniref:O-antigen polymerase n=1 Tax=Vibrio agarivorans TaxID=153622 RepID=A0ABT7XW42_9VIBR|nr:hypothetical protein [Vibrio agarivorans]MDN2479995.1 hypothetical protein [Vibrio agarivorans]